MSRRVAFRQADITRALKGAKKAGMAPKCFVVHPSGKIVVYEDDKYINAANEWDDVLNETA